MTGFPASVVARLVLGIGFTASTAAMVWVIERPRTQGAIGPKSEPPAQVTAGKTGVALTIESSYRVEGWTVQILGSDQPASRCDTVSWSGTVALAPDDEVFIQASARPEPLGQDAISVHHGLRIRLGSAPDRFVWGSGDVTATAGIAP